MSLNKVTYASTLTEFINVPSLSLASIHSICVVSSFLHFLSQMSLTSYDQILKGLLNQQRVAKQYVEKIVAVFMKILIGTCSIRDTMKRALLVCWWTHCMPMPTTSTPVLPMALKNSSFSFETVALESVQNRRGNMKYFFPSNSTTENKLSLKCPLCFLTLNVFCNSQ